MTVRWNQEEHQTVLKSMAGLMVQDGSLSFRQAFVAANLELPEARQRSALHTVKISEFFKGGIDGAIEQERQRLAMVRMEAEAEKAREGEAKAKAALLEQRSAIRAERAVKEQSTSSAEVGISETLTGVIGSFLAKTVQRVILDALRSDEGQRLLAGAVSSAVHDGLSNLSLYSPSEAEAQGAPPTKATMVAHLPRQRRPKIVVLGLEHPADLQKECGVDFELIVLPTVTTSRVIRSKLVGSDRAYLMTRFIDHRISAVVKKTGIPYTMINGGSTELIRVLKASGPSFRAPTLASVTSVKQA
jgi:hypothetical protein